MKLSLINENRPAGLKSALKFIYGRNSNPAAFTKRRLHQTKYDQPANLDHRAAGGRSADPGTPWKQRHRKFFAMSNDGGARQ